MKKILKTAKKDSSQKKTTQKTKKIEVKTVKMPKKRPKTGNCARTAGRRFPSKRSDTQRAFFLVGVLIVLSVCIAAAYINVEYEKPKEAVAGRLEQNKIEEPVTEKPKPAISVSVQLPSEQAQTPAKAPVEKQSASPVRTVPAESKTPSRASPVSANTAPAARATPSASKTSPSVTPVSANSAPASAPERKIVNSGTLVFVIDDAGNNLRELEPFLRISGPLTIAVLPGLPHSAEAARRIRAAGKEVFLHQPMEALGAQNPGPGAIYCGMSADEIRSILRRNVAEVGPIAGINNHQGSKVTMDRDAMKTILAFCAENNLRFLDSRTTAETVVPDVARQLGMAIGERNVFLDNEQDRESMLRYISNGLVRAQKDGSAVMIGHTWSPLLAPLLAEQFSLLTNQGYTIKTASSIIGK
ncbi:MAG: divergent polysaccharide deacetylase family protein [Treponema sp.]|jgi:polysaccharide deacetylase 2 family uncharacterized protein YibQ|nr:divergent polysaccharide deacetylase family protein [Treponema sp.]